MATLIGSFGSLWFCRQAFMSQVHSPPVKRYLIAGVVVLGILYIGFDLVSEYLTDRDRQSTKQQQEVVGNKVIRNLVSSEELLLDLTPRLKELSQSIHTLRLPGDPASALFADSIDLQGRLGATQQTKSSSAAIVSKEWKINASRETCQLDQLQLWEPLLGQIDSFSEAKFYFVQGDLQGESRNTFSSQVGFRGKAILKNGVHASIHAQLDLQWKLQSKTEAFPDPHDWKIISWTIRKMHSIESPQPIFQNIVTKAIPEQAISQRIAQSAHEQMISSLAQGGDYRLPPGETYPFFFPDVTLEHPGVAVVDIDSDGWDDIYVAMQRGPNLFLRNRGDHTFEDIASSVGLNVDGDSTSAVFADFDNDGDHDLFLGRARHPAMYFRNDNGKFTDVSRQNIATKLPSLVSSISTADFNGDGLLDVYLSTYSPIEAYEFTAGKRPQWVSRFLPPSKRREFDRRSNQSHTFLNRAGPPNVLLVNLGEGKFEVAKENTQLELWKMTFQASWHDYDLDGDPDLYVANDFSHDQFFRNDGPDGFSEVTEQVGFTGMGFGMGVSFADYDCDGKTDIYVSNMYSKAGKRITSRIEGLDPRFAEMAAGNFLYKRTGDGYELASGSSDINSPVAKAGWSWGGQFFDFNNDGFQDIYVVNGYYTAPDDIAVEMDL